MRRASLVVLAALLALPATASARESRHSDSMSFVKNLSYEMPERYGQSVPYGTDAGTFTTAAATQRTTLGLPTLTRRSAKRESGGFLCMLKRVRR